MQVRAGGEGGKTVGDCVVLGTVCSLPTKVCSCSSPALQRMPRCVVLWHCMFAR